MLDIKYVKDHKTGNIVYPIIKSEGIVDAFNINRPQINYLFGKVISYSIKESIKNLHILAGDTITLTLDLDTEGQVDLADIKWSSTNPEVAKVDNGVITGISEGKATIIVQSRLYGIYQEIPITIGKLKYWSITYKSPVAIPHILEKVPEEIRTACKYHYDYCSLFLGVSIPTSYMGSDYDPETQYGHWYFTYPLVSSNVIASNVGSADAGVAQTADYLIQYSFTTCTYQNTIDGTSGQATLDISPITELIFEEGLTSFAQFSSYEFSDLEKISLPQSLQDLSMYDNADGSLIIYRPHPKAAKNLDYHFTVGKNIAAVNNTTHDQISSYFGTAGDLYHFKYLTVDSGNKYFDSRNNCNAVINTETNSLVIGCPNTIIPDSVTSIAPSAFATVKLTEFTIPNTITTIGHGAFRASTLEKVFVYGGTQIPQSCFKFCSQLQQVVLHAGITEIKSAAFAQCQSLTSITFLGTMEQWNAITKLSSDWSDTSLTTINCTDGVITL